MPTRGESSIRVWNIVIHERLCSVGSLVVVQLHSFDSFLPDVITFKDDLNWMLLDI